MAAFAPFEPSPQIAVGVSGGPDSMALCLLAHRWTQARDGRATALIVDHRLRPTSTAEAQATAGKLGVLGIDAEILTWHRPPADASQADARLARYALLDDACRSRGVLHLLLGHTLEDQAETVLMRLAKGSGPDGLAAMAAVRERAALRLLRPLLWAPKSRLRATLAAAAVQAIDDPSNANRRFARARLRDQGAALAAAGLGPFPVWDTAHQSGRARAVLDLATADLLAAAATPFPEGYVELRLEPLRQARGGLALRALARCLVAVGGAAYPPRRERLGRLFDALMTGPGDAPRTLCGCLIMPPAGGRENLLICREPAAVRDDLPLVDGRRAVLWDGRFDVALPPRLAGTPDLRIRRLGGVARRVIGESPAPGTALACLPGVWAGARLVAAPKIAARKKPDNSRIMDDLLVTFVPREPLTAAPFGVV